MPYDRNSNDSLFTEILTRLDNQDDTAADYRKAVKEELAYIRGAVDKTNGRVTSLERWRDMSKAKQAVISAVLGLVGGALGWLATIIFSH